MSAGVLSMLQQGQSISPSSSVVNILMLTRVFPRSFHQQSSSTQFQMETTSTGVKISFGAPQIIAWTSQILPALPRDPNF